MTPQQLVGIGVRLFAIWLAISGIAYFTTIPSWLEGDKYVERGTFFYSYGIGTLHLASAFVLWFMPMWVAHKIVPRTQFDNKLVVPAWELARAGCGLLGLWILTRALPALAYFLFKAHLVSGPSPLVSALAKENRAELAVLAVELALGLVLVTRSARIARLIARENSPAAKQIH